ncbi:MAG: SAM-dependent methyltransferase, partial [Egibacteraceae bacterium]
AAELEERDAYGIAAKVELPAETKQKLLELRSERERMRVLADALGALVDAVDRGGVLVYETFARGQERHGRPSNPAFLLEPGELLAAVAGRLRVVAYEDLDDGGRVVQRVCARRSLQP